MKSDLFALGLQWGDEGKGKIVDSLARKFGGVMRFQGGNNAGHTLVVGDNCYKFSTLPSGVLNPDVKLIIWGGVLLDLPSLVREIESIEGANASVLENLYISDNCHLILPIHSDLEQIQEKWRGSEPIGTTCKGVGPCYEDKVARRGLRLMDLQDPSLLRKRLSVIVGYHDRIRSLESGYGKIDVARLEADLFANFDKIRRFVTPACDLFDLCQSISIVFEGAQGFMLDIDYGTYPFVTSSSTLLTPNWGKPTYKLGIAKSYCTRVGSGPFPTEQDNDIGCWICDQGKEFGTVTGRRRRCGWLDLPMLKYAASISGVDGLAMTKLDVLRGLDEVRVCYGYSNPKDGLVVNKFSMDVVRENWLPVYLDLPGWGWVYDCKQGLHPEVSGYLKYVEESLGIPVVMASMGPDRDDCVILRDFT